MYGTPRYHTCRHTHMLYLILTCHNCLPKDKPSASKCVHVEVFWNKLILTNVHFVGPYFMTVPEKNIWKGADSTELSPRINKDQSISRLSIFAPVGIWDVTSSNMGLQGLMTVCISYEVWYRTFCMSRRTRRKFPLVSPQEILFSERSDMVWVMFWEILFFLMYLIVCSWQCFRPISERERERERETSSEVYWPSYPKDR